MRGLRLGAVAAALALALVLSVGALPAPAAKAPQCAVTNINYPDYAYDSLQAALDNYGDFWGQTFLVKGTCTGATVIETPNMSSSEPLTIIGQQAKGFTAPTLNGAGVGPVVSIVGDAAIVELRSLTITGGVVPDISIGGGGIYNEGILTLTGSTVSGNEATIGGGIANGGTLTVANSTISANSAGLGGGIANVWGTVTLSRTSISGNTAAMTSPIYGYGAGGIATLAGSVELNDSTVSQNTTAGQGGGIVAVTMSDESATVTLNGRSKVNANTAAMGGGVLLVGGEVGTAELTLNDNSRVTNNTANSESLGDLNGYGGGVLLANQGTSLTLNNSSYISGNTAAVAGGGIAYGGTLGATLTNCTELNVYRNTPDNIYDFTS